MTERRVEITVDGRPIVVREGTVLAGALLEAGITRFRASVRGEPRAPLCGMGTCFECRVTIDGVPHRRSCMVRCEAGMIVETERPGIGNRESGIATRESGVGSREGEEIEQEWDVVVVGGGPAGIAAATRAAERGARVLVLDQWEHPGGQIWRHRDRASLPARARRWIERCERSGARWLARAAVVGGTPERGLLADVEGRALRVRARSMVLATGARELFLPFPGWTLPGVIGAGGAQALVKGGMRARGRRVVVAGSGPLLLPAAAALRHAGARVLAMAEQAPAARVARFTSALWAHPAKLAQAARWRASLAATPYRAGTWVVRADGAERVERVTLTDGRRTRELACDFLACGWALVPSIELACLLGCDTAGGRVVVDALQRTSVPGVLCAGEPTGVAGEDAALVQGEIAGLAAAGDERGASAASLQRARREWRRFAELLAEAFDPRTEVRALADDATVVCRCEDVARGALLPEWSARQAKLYTRLSMGPCQGAVCGAACDALWGWAPNDPREPVVPAAVGVIAGSGKREAGSD